MSSTFAPMRSIAGRLRASRAFFRLASFRWMEAQLREFQAGEGTRFDVTVRSGGVGALLIGQDNVFGFRLAPRYGTGEILLQPRSQHSEIRIGRGNRFSNNVAIVANLSVTIGDRCQIGDCVSIVDCDFHELASSTRNRSEGISAPVRIGDNVWLGSRAMVLKGVEIGENSVVGAMSVVTKSIPPNSVVAGSPARVIRAI